MQKTNQVDELIEELGWYKYALVDNKEFEIIKVQALILESISEMIKRYTDHIEEFNFDTDSNFIKDMNKTGTLIEEKKEVELMAYI